MADWINYGRSYGPLSPEQRSRLAYAAAEYGSSPLRTFLNTALKPHEGHEIVVYQPVRADVLFAFECLTCGGGSQTLVYFAFTQPATLGPDVCRREP